jgi:D-lactate dehydrogenase
MSLESTRAFIDGIELFAILPESMRTDIASLATFRELSPGEYLFREGEPGTFMFVVERGWLDVRKRGTGDGEVTLRSLGPGEIGGITSMVERKERSASLCARNETRVLTLEREAFVRLFDARAELPRALVSYLSTKVRGKTTQLASLIGAGEQAGRTRVALFDAKPYDKEYFDARLGQDLAIEYFEAKLGPRTARLAAGFPVVCAFVNDDLGGDVVERLAEEGVGLIALRCAGFNNVDLHTAARVGISVARVPAYSPHAVAEHAAALMLTLNRRTYRAYNRVREGNFSLAGLVGFDLYGRTAGVIGLGKIGRCFARIAAGFGMMVLAYDAFPDPAAAAELGLDLVGLDEVFERADVISLHAPLTPDTFHLVNGSRVSQMRRGVMLINTSRGALVDAAALIEGLKQGRIGAAGLDVYEEESEYFFEDRSDQVITDDLLARLMTFPNVLVTSHQAFLTREALGNIADTTLANIREYLAGKRGSALSNVVLAS